MPAAPSGARSTPRWSSYYESATFLQGLAKSTQGPQRSLLERWRKDHGELPLKPLQSRHIQGFISKLGSPSVQRNMLRAIRHFTKFAVGAGLIDVDPAIGVTRAKMTKTGGFYAWTEEDAAKFEARHPVGSMARLALALYLNLGVRKSDVVLIGPRHIRDGILHNFLPQKTSHNGGKRILSRCSRRRGDDRGNAGHRHRDLSGDVVRQAVHRERVRQQDAAMVRRGRTAGLYKPRAAQAVHDPLVHAGYTAPQIGALSGHKDLREIQLYIDEMDRHTMGIETSASFEKVQIANRKLLTESPVSENDGKVQ